MWKKNIIFIYCYCYRLFSKKTRIILINKWNEIKKINLPKKLINNVFITVSLSVSKQEPIFKFTFLSQKLTRIMNNNLMIGISLLNYTHHTLCLRINLMALIIYSIAN